MKAVAIIPARGGSKGIPRKSIRPLAGKPLIYYAIEACKACTGLAAVYVTTDDPEIAMLAHRFGAQVIHRPEALANDAATLDPVIEHAMRSIEEQEGTGFDVVVTVQATSPLVLPADIEEALYLFENPETDTVLSVVDDRHLCWRIVDGQAVPAYERRVNRQALPSNFRETGAVIACRRGQLSRGTRIGSRVQLLEMPQLRSFDIDSIADFHLCESMLLRRKVVFTVVGYPEVGLGHVYRTLLLAHELVSCEIHFVCEASSKMAAKIIASKNYQIHECEDGALLQSVLTLKPDFVINDILDTDAAYIFALKQQGLRVVNFEDMGSGADIADLVVNALYSPHNDNDNLLSGPHYFCLRDEFIYLPERPARDSVQRVLITFGGADDADLTSQVLRAIEPICRGYGIFIDIVTGPGYRHHEHLNQVLMQLPRDVVNYVGATTRISDYMCTADLAVTSGGRTVLELAALQVPTMVICQSYRETIHEFASQANGVMNFGLWTELDLNQFIQKFEMLIESSDSREEMRRKASSIDLRKGKKRVIDAIISLSSAGI
ncbi:hypothetical protein BO996_00225 [Delftia sp. HK171]|uniref:cytidylyltransferase domain-containing protein n=1 Tax=Delftia sp. HK171 TaxID=1920191 RepID=UPI00090380CD|nr:glycosyltransferase [Delftia sp. HK171]APE46392.1 hypothetical protein BO996_00225 [Delftia sp. HK171]